MSPQLTDADIAKLDASQGGRPLTDADIAVHDKTAKPQDAGFWGTIIPDLMNAPGKLLDAVSGHPIDRLKEAVGESNAGNATAWQQVKDAYGKGNYEEAFEHLLGVVPGVGPGINTGFNKMREPEPGQPYDETHGGKFGEGAANVIESVLPFMGEAPVGARTAADVTAGTVRGAYKGATETIPINRYGMKVNVPAPIAGAAAGGVVGGLSHIPMGGEIGAAVGAATPIVRGGIRGFRAAVEAARPQAPIGPRAVPIWEDLTAPTPSEPPQMAPAQPVALPSGRIPGQPIRPSAATAPVETPATPVAPAVPTLDDIAQGQMKKPFAKLKAADQATVLQIQNGIKNSMAEPAPAAAVPVPVATAEPSANVPASIIHTGESIAKESGEDWGKLSKEQKQDYKDIAEARNTPELTSEELTGIGPPKAYSIEDLFNEQPSKSSQPPLSRPAPPPTSSATLAEALRQQLLESGTLDPTKEADYASPEPAPAVSQPALDAAIRENIPKGKRKVVADAVYRANKQGDTTVPPGQVYESAARGEKVDPLVDHLSTELQKNGISAADAETLKDPQFKPHWAALAHDLGIKPPSTVTISQVIEELKKREAQPK